MSGPGSGIGTIDIGSAFPIPGLDTTAFVQPGAATAFAPTPNPVTAAPQPQPQAPPPPFDANIADTTRQIEAGRKLGGELQPTDFRGRFA